MNIYLPPELEEMVKKKVESGCYLTDSEVIVEAL
jgi:Arc/MetJ-type ribon-helix-helix transcriptional regulator